MKIVRILPPSEDPEAKRFEVDGEPAGRVDIIDGGNVVASLLVGEDGSVEVRTTKTVSASNPRPRNKPMRTATKRGCCW